MNEKTYKSGDEIAVQLAPFGTFANHDGKPGHNGVPQTIDDESIAAMMANFKNEVVVDCDHKSMTNESTEAAAWVTKLWRDPKKGLMANFRLTAKGAELVSDGRFKYVSPVWFFGENQKPARLDSVALTNRPNIPVEALANSDATQDARFAIANPLHFSPCLSNSKADGSDADASDGVLEASDAVGAKDAKENDFEIEQNTNERSPHMDELKTVLGLAAEATDAEIVDAVKALKAKNDELEAKAKEAEAEEFAAANEDKGIEKEALKNAYLASPEVVGKLLANMKAPEKPVAPVAPTTPLCNSRDAMTPDMEELKQEPFANAHTSDERIAVARKMKTL